MALGTEVAEAQESWATYRGRDGRVGLEIPTPPGAVIEERSSLRSVTYSFTRGDEHAELFLGSCRDARPQLACKTEPPRFVERWQVVAGPAVRHGLEGQVGDCLYLTAPLDETLGNDVRRALREARASLWGLFPGARLEPQVRTRQRSRAPKAHPGELGEDPGASAQALGLLTLLSTSALAVILHQRRRRQRSAAAPRVF